MSPHHRLHRPLLLAALALGALLFSSHVVAQETEPIPAIEPAAESQVDAGSEGIADERDRPEPDDAEAPGNEVEEPESGEETDEVAPVVLEEEAQADSSSQGEEQVAGERSDKGEKSPDFPERKAVSDSDPKYVSEIDQDEELGVRVWQGLRGDRNYFGFDGASQMDFGFADYRFSTPTFAAEQFFDFRGQSWLGPVFEHRFGPNQQMFLRGSFELVAWFREEVGIYQVNVFDAYAQVGMRDVANLQAGRFTFWRVYQPGLGFDIFTLEDNGAMKEGPIEAEDFYVRTYQLDDMWLRDTPGRVALHGYPLKKVLPAAWNDLGVELGAQYGKRGLNNTVGLRGSFIYDTPYFRLAAGYETREQQKATEIRSLDGDLCSTCTLQTKRGWGINTVLHPPYVNLGFNYMDQDNRDYGANGSGEDVGINEITTLSGFAELHTGHWIARGPGKPWHADQRSQNIRKLTVGVGASRTEKLIATGDFEQHIQAAAYVQYNLGFNQSILKFVVSKANGLDDTDVSSDPNNPDIITKEGDMLAARLRFTYYF